MTDPKPSLDCASCYYYVQGIDRACVNYLPCTRALDKGLEYERTCANKSIQGKRLLMCSRCGAFTSVTNATEHIGVRYCGYCGAKVVEE